MGRERFLLCHSPCPVGKIVLLIHSVPVEELALFTGDRGGVEFCELRVDGVLVLLR